MAVEKRGKFWFLQLANGLHGKMARPFYRSRLGSGETCLQQVFFPGATDSLPQGMQGRRLVLWEWWPRGPEGTPSAKICLKLPLMFPALAMISRELKYAQSLHG